MTNFAAGARFFQRWLARKPHSGERLAASPTVALRVLERAMVKAGRIGGLRGILTDLLTLGRLVKAWVKRDYRAVSRGTIVVALGAIAYFLAPIDAIVDALPFVGFIDDAAVLAWVLREVRVELAAFRSWEETRNGGASLATAPSVPQIEGIVTP